MLLREQLASPDWTRRRAAANALGKHQKASEAAPDLRVALADQSPYVVRAVIEALAAIKDKESRPRVLSLLRDRDPATRASAVCALGALWEPVDVGPVLHAAQTDRSAEVRKQASWVLHEHAASASWEQLFGLWSQSDVPRERIWATELAAAFGGSDITDVLKPFLTDTDGHVRRAAERVVKSRDIAER